MVFRALGGPFGGKDVSVDFGGFVTSSTFLHLSSLDEKQETRVGLILSFSLFVYITAIVEILTVSPPGDSSVSTLNTFQLPPTPYSFKTSSNSRPLYSVELSTAFLDLSVSSKLVRSDESPVLSVEVILSIYFVPRLYHQTFWATP